MKDSTRTAFVSLGRLGDIAILLPGMKHLFDTTGQKPVMVVSSMFASILDGVSYVEPMVMPNFDFVKDVEKAKKIAEGKFEKVILGKWWDIPGAKPPGNISNGPIITLNNGKIKIAKDKWNSYMTSAWEAAGFTPQQMKDLPLVFDRRDKKREAALVASWKKTKKPLLLVNLNGQSSPYLHKHDLMNHIMLFRNIFEIVDCGSIRADRIYDLLGLYDVAAGLITIDTATLHLAAASSVPTIALLAEGGRGSFVKSNCILELRYSAIQKSKHLISQAIQSMGRHWRMKTVRINDIVPSIKNQTNWECAFFDFSQTNFPLQAGINYFNCGAVTRPDGDWLIVRRSKWNGALGHEFNDLLAFKMDGTTLSEGVKIDVKKTEQWEHFEDPRAVYYNGQIFLSCTNFHRAGTPFTNAHQILVALDNDWKTVERYDPEFGRNGADLRKNSGPEKNWIWFFEGDKSLMIYQTYPHKIVEFKDKFKTVTVHETKAAGFTWKNGEPRGSTPPVLIDDEYWTFFHSSEHDSKIKLQRYFVGAYAFSKNPPYAMTRAVTKPLLVGTMLHGGDKPVVFPCGALLKDGIWLMTLGVNDAECAYMKIPHEELLGLTEKL